MKKIIWKDVNGFEGQYQVSSLGEIRSVRRIVRNTGGFRVVSEKIKSTQLNNKGYVLVHLYKNNKRKAQTVHSIVARAFIGIRPKNLQVCHLDNNKQNNECTNLVYGTVKENFKMTKMPRGSEITGSKLTKYNILEIREMLKNGISISKISKKFGVTRGNIYFIKNRKTWNWVK